jgi:GNAT superfamily N-acetyltransferase
MLDDVKIRAATVADYPRACVLLDQLDEFHRERLPWLLRTPPTPPRGEQYFSDLITSEDSVVFVAETHDVIGIAITFLRTAPDLSIFIPQRWGVLDALAVAAECRRAGVGTRLVRAAEQWTRQKGVPWLELGVYEFNADARKFYERLGYLPLSSKLKKTLSNDG